MEETTTTQPLIPAMKELSCKEMLHNLMTDEGLLDCTLEGDDGVTIKVNRFALAARSPVFRRMFFGEFVESKHHPQQRVKIGFHSSVLKAVVEYIHTDSAAILHDNDDKNNNESTNNGSSSVPNNGNINHQVQTLVSMTAAGMYFHLPGLTEKSHQFLSELLESHPELSFAVLEGSKQAGPSVPEELEALALSKIRSLVEPNLNPSSDMIAMLSPELMEEIVKDPHMETYELELFKMLQIWADAPQQQALDSETITTTRSCYQQHQNNNSTTTTTTLNNNNPPDENIDDGDDVTTSTAATTSSSSSSTISRRDMAIQMTKHIQLENIDPLNLSTIVATSGLVTTQQLLDAYKQQALAAQQDHNIAYNKHRKMPEWESVHDSFRKCLSCPPIRAGSHIRWTLEVKEHGRYLWIGIVHQGSGALYAFSSWSDGVRLYLDESYGNPHTDLRALKLATGSKVTFVLNMTPSDSANGTLSASVNGGPLLVLFSDLLDRLDNNEDNNGFVPAMCLKSPASVGLLSLEKV